MGVVSVATDKNTTEKDYKTLCRVHANYILDNQMHVVILFLLKTCAIGLLVYTQMNN